MRTPVNFFIVNMAMSDLLFPIFQLPLTLTGLYSDSWLIGGIPGKIVCKLAAYLNDVSLLVSVQSLVLVAVDRFGAVVFPLRSPLVSLKLCPFFILATWVVSLAVISPYLMAFNLSEEQGDLFCYLDWIGAFGEHSSWTQYSLSLYVVFVFIPIALVSAIYSIILVKLKLQKIPGEKSVNAERERAKRNKNVMKMAIAIVLGFTICWLPISVGKFVIGPLSADCSLYLKIAQYMAFSNCAVNPVVCFIFSGNYRKALRKIVINFCGTKQS